MGDGSLFLVGIESGGVRLLHKATGWITNAAFAPDGETMAIDVSHGNLQLISASTGQQYWSHGESGYDQISCLAFSPDGRMVALGSGHYSNSIVLYDTTSGNLLAELEGYCGIAFTFDGRELVFQTDDFVRFWRIDSPHGESAP